METEGTIILANGQMLKFKSRMDPAEIRAEGEKLTGICSIIGRNDLGNDVVLSFKAEAVAGIVLTQKTRLELQ